ncbi:MAG TPA: MFS transporter, partial [Amaricoccus sp.]|nr:MFS transporter [Amaricoccus sp.]
KGVAVAALGTLAGGAAWVLALSLFNVTVQLSAPRWVLGRALALYQTAAFGGMALGSWLWGWVAESHGLPQALAGAAIALVLSGLVGLRLPLPDRTDLNLDPLNRFVEPLLSLDLKPRSGPILIEVEYLIGEADVADFLGLMAERQRLRLRDGARQWTLQRDLANPALWVESYQTPTWVDYVRHNMRRTQADATTFDGVSALHRGPAPPRVSRRIIRQARWTGEEPAPKPPIDHH